MLADAVGIINFADVRAGLALNGVHEELFRLFGILPSHLAPIVNRFSALARRL